MTRTLISNGKILTPDSTLNGKSLLIEDDSIVSIEDDSTIPCNVDNRIDAKGFLISPGLIDIHLHGAVGYDTMDATSEAIQNIARFIASHGVTSYLPTTMSAASEDIDAAIMNLSNCQPPSDGAIHVGAHIEGPYLNPNHKGAQPESQLRDPDPNEYEAWIKSNVVKLISIAPECTGALDLIDLGISHGIEFAVAHSGASYSQVVEAADHGLRQATHTFNGMKGLHHRNPGTVGAVLTDDRIYAQVIADGIHVHPAVIDLIVRAKGISRTILITDSIRAVGLKDGVYELGEKEIIVSGGVSRTKEGGLAGSTLTMDAAIRNMATFTGLSLEQILPSATYVPAESIGLLPNKGLLAPGSDADIVIFDNDMNIRLTIIAGRIINNTL